MLKWPPAAGSTRLPGHRERPDFRYTLAFAALLSVLLHLALLRGLVFETPSPAPAAPTPVTEITLASPEDFARAAPPPPAKTVVQPGGEVAPPDTSAASPPSESEKDAEGWIQSHEALSTKELANPRNRKTLAALQTLEPQTRLQQLCDLEAILQINRRYPERAVDFIVAYAREPAVRTGASLIAHGAALHGAGEWRQLAFECELSPNQHDVARLKFKIGDPIPAAQWAALNLPKSPAPLGED